MCSTIVWMKSNEIELSFDEQWSEHDQNLCEIFLESQGKYNDDIQSEETCHAVAYEALVILKNLATHVLAQEEKLSNLEILQKYLHN